MGGGAATLKPILIEGGTLVLRAMPGVVRAVEGDLLIDGERISAVGEIEPIPDDCERVDARGCVVLPGFVQTHVHLCQTLFRGIADDLPLLEWLQESIWPLEAAHDPDSLRASARLAVAELLLGGTTAVQTMETVHHTEAVFEVLEEAGLFAVAGKCLMDDQETAPEGLVQPTATAIGEAVELAETWEGRNGGRLRYCLAPRFAVSCTENLLREVGELAAKHGWRIHTHASENLQEVALVEQRSGRRNITYLNDVGCTGEHVGLAHCIWVDDDEVELLARTRTHVLHCPGSNCKLGSGIAAVPDLLDEGISVSLGADGAPCNNNLDMFHEMRLAALLHKPRFGPEAMAAHEVLWMATVQGALALGREEGELGVLAPGAWANVVVVDLERIHHTPAPDPLSALVYSARSADVRDVWLAGKQVVADHHLTLWDEQEIQAEANREAKKLFARADL